jgi:hypothetical protein
MRSQGYGDAANDTLRRNAVQTRLLIVRHVRRKYAQQKKKRKLTTNDTQTDVPQIRIPTE